MPAIKRPAAATTGVKRAKADPTAQSRKTVLAALAKRGKGVDALPADVLAMLSAMFANALGPAPTPEEPEPCRHPCQEKLLDFIHAELQKIDAALAAEAKAEHDVVASAGDERARREEAVKAATSAHADKKTAVDSAKAALAAAKATSAIAKAAFAEAKAAEAAGEQALADAETKLATLELAVETKSRLHAPAAPLTSPAAADVSASPAGAVASPGKVGAKSPAKSPAKRGTEAASLVKSLAGFIKDESLLDAVRITLTKKVDELGDFDMRVMQQFEDALTEAVEAQRAAVAALTGDSKAARAAETQRCEAAAGNAAEQETNAELTESDALCAAEEADVALKAAMGDVSGHDLEIEAARARAAALDAKVADFRSGPMATFQALRTPAPLMPEDVPEATETGEAMQDL